MSAPTVTVLVPARDEEAWIEDCLRSITRQTFPRHLIQVVVVVDGGCVDRTCEVARDVLEGSDLGSVEVIRNVDTGTPANLNAGLSLASGTILCRVDARSRIPENYVERCVDLLEGLPEVSVVGGAQIAVAPHETALGTGIARALNNRWAMGLSRYRRGAPSGPADTVYLGAFRSADLRAVGGWSRAMTTNQDFELNRRMARRGIVWFQSGLPVEYVPRSDLPSLFRQYRRFGEWKVRYWRLSGDRPRARQWALLAVPPVGLVLAALVERRHVVPAIGMSLVAASLIETTGTAGPAAGPRARACAVAAMGAVTAGWLSGILSGCVRVLRD
jgi:succinoglycan biosynthesis protein ExoA